MLVLFALLSLFFVVRREVIYTVKNDWKKTVQVNYLILTSVLYYLLQSPLLIAHQIRSQCECQRITTRSECRSGRDGRKSLSQYGISFTGIKDPRQSLLTTPSTSNARRCCTGTTALTNNDAYFSQLRATTTRSGTS